MDYKCENGILPLLVQKVMQYCSISFVIRTIGPFSPHLVTSLSLEVPADVMIMTEATPEKFVVLAASSPFPSVATFGAGSRNVHARLLPTAGTPPLAFEVSVDEPFVPGQWDLVPTSKPVPWLVSVSLPATIHYCTRQNVAGDSAA